MEILDSSVEDQRSDPLYKNKHHHDNGYRVYICRMIVVVVVFILSLMSLSYISASIGYLVVQLKCNFKYDILHNITTDNSTNIRCAYLGDFLGTNVLAGIRALFFITASPEDYSLGLMAFGIVYPVLLVLDICCIVLGVYFLIGPMLVVLQKLGYTKFSKNLVDGGTCLLGVLWILFALIVVNYTIVKGALLMTECPAGLETCKVCMVCRSYVEACNDVITAPFDTFAYYYIGLFAKVFIGSVIISFLWGSFSIFAGIGGLVIFITFPILCVLLIVWSGRKFTNVTTRKVIACAAIILCIVPCIVTTVVLLNTKTTFSPKDYSYVNSHVRSGSCIIASPQDPLYSVTQMSKLYYNTTFHNDSCVFSILNFEEVKKDAAMLIYNTIKNTSIFYVPISPHDIYTFIPFNCTTILDIDNCTRDNINAILPTVELCTINTSLPDRSIFTGDHESIKLIITISIDSKGPAGVISILTKAHIMRIFNACYYSFPLITNIYISLGITTPFFVALEIIKKLRLLPTYDDQIIT